MCDSYEEKVVRITDGYVRYQIYYNDDNEKMMGWFLLSEPQYLTAKDKERCCPVYVFEIKEGANATN